MTHKFKGHSHAFTTTQCHAFLPFGFYIYCFEMISGTTLEKKECPSGCCNVTDAVKSALPAVRRRVGATDYVVWSAKESAGACEVSCVDPPPTPPLAPPPTPLCPPLAHLDPLVKKRHLPVWVGGALGAEGHHAASCELRVVKQLV